MNRRGARPTVYPSRLDRFRVHHDIDLRQWAALAVMPAAQLLKYRSGAHDLRCDALARLVRAASILLQRPVKASELYDFGEDEPVPDHRYAFPLTGQEKIRVHHDSRLSLYLQGIGASPAAMARLAGLSRQTLLALRREKALPMCATIRRLVVTLRRLGYPVRASDLFDCEDVLNSAYHEASG